MSDSLIIGLLAGMVAGAVVATMCKPVQNVINSGKEEVKKAIDKLR